MKINWCVNTYIYVEGIRKRIEKVSFGESYEKAKKYYWKYKVEERKQGRYLELIPYKA